jgi:O-antigen/teichoic acid export membrane protein
LILFGTNTSANRFLTNYLNLESADNLRDYLSWNIRLVRNTALFCLIFITIILGTLNLLQISNVILLADLHLTFHLLWVAPLSAVVLLLSSFLLCSKNYRLSYFFSNFAKYFFMFSFAFVAVYLFDIIIDTTQLVWMVSIAFIIVFVIEVLLFWYYAPIKLWNHLKSAWSSSTQNKRSVHKQAWKKTAGYLIMNNLTYMVLTSADLLIVELVAPNEASVGYYASALAVTAIIFVVSRSIYTYIKPNINAHIQNKEFDVLQTKLNHANYFATGVLLPLVVLLNIFSKQLFLLFGDHFSGSVEVTFLILSVGFCVGALLSPAVYILSYSGNERLVTKVTFIEFAVLIVLGVVLTYYFGIEGTAVACVTAILVKSVLLTMHVKRIYPLRPYFF